MDLVTVALPFPAMAAAAATALRILRIRKRRQMFLLRKMLLRYLEILRCPNNLATQRAETEGIKQATLTNFAGVGDTFAGPRLGPFIQEHDLCTVDNVGLNRCDVQILLNLRNSNHIMVR
jgi:hypothetical protein